MKSKNNAFTLTELMISAVLVILLFGSAYGIFITSKSVSVKDLESANLKRDVNVVLQKIIQGYKEGQTIYGVRSAISYELPVVNPTGSEIDFNGTDDQTRKFFLNGRSVMYESPTQFPTQKTVYTAPADSTVILRFWKPAGYIDNETVGIYFSLSRQVRGRTVSGSLSTYVNLRNVPK